MELTSEPRPARDTGFGTRLLDLWRRLSALPGGAWAFSRLVGRLAPYSGTIGARVVSLEPGRAVVEVHERRSIRNHLRSVHAIALANLGELSSGLATLTALPPGVRGIPVEISIRYLKKARGLLTATGTAVIPSLMEVTAVDVHAAIRDESGEVVAEVRVTWQLERA